MSERDETIIELWRECDDLRKRIAELESENLRLLQQQNNPSIHCQTFFGVDIARQALDEMRKIDTRHCASF